MRTGLYSPGEFKDNCGFGMIAHMQGQASHQLLQTAIEALTCMTHRGGISADGRTGDGCGLLLKKPDSFLRAIARELFNTEMSEHFAVGARPRVNRLGARHRPPGRHFGGHGRQGLGA